MFPDFFWNKIIIERTVFMRVTKIYRSRFNAARNILKEQGFIERDGEFVFIKEFLFFR